MTEASQIQLCSDENTILTMVFPLNYALRVLITYFQQLCRPVTIQVKHFTIVIYPPLFHIITLVKLYNIWKQTHHPNYSFLEVAHNTIHYKNKKTLIHDISCLTITPPLFINYNIIDDQISIYVLQIHSTHVQNYVWIYGAYCIVIYDADSYCKYNLNYMSFA